MSTSGPESFARDLHAAYYFSDRLPIALTAGRPLAYGWEQGLDRIFPGECSPCGGSAQSTEAVDQVRLAVSWSEDVRSRFAAAERFAVERLTSSTALK